MKKNLLIFMFLCLSFSNFGQIGIGNTTPKAQLDITASSTSSPSTTDGLLIPRVTAFPAPVTVAQNGMLVFLTTAFGSNQVGFYYYDFPTTTWKWIAAGNNLSPWVRNNSNTRIDVPFQSDGATARPLGNEAVILDNGNVGFGTLIPVRHFQVNRDINAGTKFAVSNPNIGAAAFSQITAEAPGSTAYMYSINQNYVFDPTYPWFKAANMLLQGTGTGGLSLGATDTIGNINFFTGGRDESMRITAAGNVGIGTKTPVSPLHISGPNASVVLDRFGVGSHFIGRTANGTQLLPTALNTNEIAARWSGWGHNGTGYWPVGVIDIMTEENQTLTAAGGFIKFTTTDIGGTSSNEKMRITSTGNVGIGTTTPGEKLEIAGGGVRINKPFGIGFGETPKDGNVTNDDSAKMYYDTNAFGTNLDALVIEKTDSNDVLNPDGGILFTNKSNNNIRVPSLAIRGTGNVGINTINPQEKLEVVGNIKSEKATIGDFTGVTLNSSISGIPKISFYPSDNSERFNLKLTSNSTTTNDLLSFNSTTVNNALVIKGDGNVGIGESAPVYKLQTKGDIASTDGLIGRSIFNTGMSTTTVFSDNIEPWTDNGIKLYDGNTNSHLHLEAVGFGLIQSYGTSGSAKGLLEVAGTTSNLILQRDGSNLGIGNNILPTEKLDVTGNIRLSGALMPNNLTGTTGQVLTSAGAGVAPTWNNPSSQLLSYVTTGASTGIYSVNISQYTIRIFNSVSEVRLPNAVGNSGKIFIIIGSNAISSKTLSTLGGSIYDDVTNTTYTTISGSQRFMVQSDGTDWIVIGR